MMFYMNSKTFQKDFLSYESYENILNAQYVICSTRIRCNSTHDNVISARTALFPDAEVASALTDDILKERYFVQLDDNIILIASLIKYSLSGENIIFMCTPTEDKIKYLQYLSEFVMDVFGYPIYNYKEYSRYMIGDVKFDKEKVKAKVKEVLQSGEDKAFIRELKKMIECNDEKQMNKMIKVMDKNDLKKYLKKEGLYRPGLTKEQMKDLAIYSITN